MAIEAKRVNCFPFCDEHTPASYSGESAPLFLLHHIHHHCQTMPNDTLFFSFCLLLFLSRVGRFVAIPSATLLHATVFALTNGNGDLSLSKQTRQSQTSDRETCTWHQHLGLCLALSKYGKKKWSTNSPGEEDDWTKLPTESSDAPCLVG